MTVEDAVLELRKSRLRRLALMTLALRSWIRTASCARERRR